MTDEKIKNINLINRCYTIAISTAFVAAAATIIISTLILANHIRLTMLIDRQDKSLTRLKTDVNQADATVVPRIRQLDVQYRQNWFYRLDFTQKGGYLLLGSVIIMLLGFKLASTLSNRLPSPGPAADKLKEQNLLAKYSRRSLTLGAAIVAAGMVIFAQTAGIDVSKPEVAQSNFPSQQEIHNWPRFRGAFGTGIVADINVPQTWDGKTGKGIVWKSPVPLDGKNSPIVWNDRIFMSGADPNQQKVFCFDAAKGNLLWTGDVNVPPLKPGQKKLELNGSTDAGYAAATMTTDGQRAFVIFPTGVVACFDFGGKKIWEKNLGRPENSYGYACSLLMFKNLLLIQYDQGEEESQKSEMLAIDGSTGNFAWRTKRPVGDSWSTPTIINSNGRYQLITCSEPWVISYNPADGKELWRVKCLEGDVAACPIYANGLVIVIEMYKKFIAIRPDGSGDVTKTHIAWSVDAGSTPEIGSPVSNGDLIFIPVGDVALSCFKSQDGTKVWNKDIGPYFSASPSLVDNKLYLLSEKGDMYILEAGTEYKLLTKNELGELCLASPAFVNGRIYLRSEKNLICIGE
jgi:outer membrane protein assembly factor BamB